MLAGTTRHVSKNLSRVRYKRVEFRQNALVFFRLANVNVLYMCKGMSIQIFKERIKYKIIIF